MIKRHVRVDGWGLLVHRLVQELTRLRLGADGRRPRLEQALELTDAVAVGDPQDVRTWPVWDALAPHVRVLVAHADEAGHGGADRAVDERAGSLFTFQSVVRRGRAALSPGAGD